MKFEARAGDIAEAAQAAEKVRETKGKVIIPVLRNLLITAGDGKVGGVSGGELDQAVLKAVDELAEESNLSDRTWSTLAAHLSASDPRWEDVRARERENNLGGRIKAAMAARETDRRGDVISTLLNARDKGFKLTEGDITSLSALMVGAGIDTTAGLLGSTFMTLMRHPNLRPNLKADSKLARGAFDEFMRLNAPTQGLCRTVTRDVEAFRNEFSGESARDIVVEETAPDGGFVVRKPAPTPVTLTVTPNLEAATMVCHYRFTLTNGLPQRDCYVNVLREAMAVDALDSCGIYFGTTGGQVYASADAGDSWAPIVRDLPAVLSVEAQTLP